MSYAYILGPQQPDERAEGGEDQTITGGATGILVLDLRYPLSWAT